jgi:carbonic anhydrase/acetyltransferase-like protein (isoleucine patch superfamily)
VTTYRYRNTEPRVDPSAFVAQGAVVAGDVEIQAGASIWFNAVVRGDSDRVAIGARTNVQDNAVLHTDPRKPCLVGEECTIGHGAVVHGCRIGDRCLVGMGAIVLSGVAIGAESLIAAGAVVLEGQEFEPRALLVGSPARVVRMLSDEDVNRLIRPGAEHYLDYAKGYGDLSEGSATPRS